MQTRIMAPEQVQRTLSRLAYEVIEHNRGSDNLVIVGIQQCGAVLAEALAHEIRSIEDQPVQVVPLDVQPYRDDRDRSQPIDDTNSSDVDVSDRTVILVDDVLFTGRTARAALDAIVRYGRPRSIQLVVLIDRGHREYPIQPDYVGRVIPTKHKERVVVDGDDTFAVYVEE